MRPRHRQDEATLTDRVALAFLSGLSALAAGGLIWLSISLLSAQLLFDWVPPFSWVLWFAGAMAMVGFLLLENLVVRLAGGIWRWVGHLLSIWT